MAPYRCSLIDVDGESTGSVYLSASSEVDAILLGNTIKQEHPTYVGVEIRNGSRLVYMHTEYRER